jgi:hypothetical protein
MYFYNPSKTQIYTELKQTCCKKQPYREENICFPESASTSPYPQRLLNPRFRSERFKKLLSSKFFFRVG